MYVIYALIDPRDNTVRYVGITDDVYKRFLSHIQCTGGNLAKNLWIAELRAANKMVIMETLEEVEDHTRALEREMYWIQHFQALKEPLANINKTVSARKAKKTNARVGRAISLNLIQYQDTEDRREIAQTMPALTPLERIQAIANAAGKMRAEGASIDAILKAHGLPPGGRNNQNLKALLDGQGDQAANE